jgi:hypothetical protein
MAHSKLARRHIFLGGPKARNKPAWGAAPGKPPEPVKPQRVRNSTPAAVKSNRAITVIALNGQSAPAAIAFSQMIATVQLTDEEIKNLCDLTRTDNAEGAVRSALDEYRRYARRMRLKGLSGQVTAMARVSSDWARVSNFTASPRLPPTLPVCEAV